jgi:membrane-bound lytic murein transglycosylase B
MGIWGDTFQMSVRLRLGARLSAALVVVAVPVSMAGLSPTIVPTSNTVVPRDVASAHVTTAPLSPSVTTMPRHYVRTLPAQRPQVVAEQSTIAGGLALETKKERNRKIAVSSSKGSRVWTASALAEHDLPSAAMRAYKNAASSIDATDPGCHLPWTLLAGVGRVESDHGRYGGSVLASDGVPRPAIVGVALNGKGPVAAIHDTDNGDFDGDKVWDRAVGPMQFIPSTWNGGARRDGDGDGTMSPNDIDDAALAAAAYLCNAGGDLGDETAEKNAVFRYNPSDYYVALVTAFARGYRTGVFVIPSPDVDPGDAAAKAKAQAAKAKANAKAEAKAARAKAAKARAAKALARAQAASTARAGEQARQRAKAAAARAAAARTAAARAAARHRASTSTPTKAPTSSGSTSGGGTTSSPSPSSPSPDAPKLLTATGVLTAVDGGGWMVDGVVKVTLDDLEDIALKDYDGDTNPDGQETMAQELDGLVARRAGVSISYYELPGFSVNGFSAL